MQVRRAFQGCATEQIDASKLTLVTVRPYTNLPQDWSWNKPAHTYIELYYAAME